MLVLSRTIMQSVTIDDDIEVSILGIKGNQVRIGIKAPKNVSVNRKEIQERIYAEKQTQLNINNS